MINKIIFPYDFSKFSKIAEEYVSECSKLGAKEVVIVHVVEYEELFTNVLFKENEIRKLKQDAEERLLPVKNNLQQEGFSVRTVIDFGIPSKIILKVAEEEKADLIIIGAQGRSAAMDFLLGSTALNVLRHSKIPVMIIPDKNR
jgi:nucleotide-binding universal stress UspA family protein